MNKAFEKILDRLDDGVSLPKMNGMERRVGKSQTQGFGIGVLFAKEIVKEVAKEYKDCWIACSERLPEIGQEVIVATKNGSVYSNIYYDYTESKAKEPCFHMWDDEMWNCFKPDVIAWQPLPEPYKEG